MADHPQTFDADLDVDGRTYPLYERVYLLLAATFAVLLVLTNIIGIKLFYAPAYEVTSTVLFFIPSSEAGFALTTGIITYPLTFLITDLVSEIYGKRRADFMVLLGFLMSVLMLVITQIAMRVPAHPYWVPAEGPFYDDVAFLKQPSFYAINAETFHQKWPLPTAGLLASTQPAPCQDLPGT